MELGAFSVSLAVKDIRASKDFYEKLGFKAFGGDVTRNWVILKNGVEFATQADETTTDPDGNTILVDQHV
jgi:extradiol dioxygenase family protein